MSIVKQQQLENQLPDEIKMAFKELHIHRHLRVGTRRGQGDRFSVPTKATRRMATGRVINTKAIKEIDR